MICGFDNMQAVVNCLQISIFAISYTLDDNSFGRVTCCELLTN